MRRDDLPDAVKAFAGLVSRIDGRPICLFADYDGTVTPIVAQPEDAILGEDMADTLARFAAGHFLAFVSGRDLADLRERACIDGAWLAGSHGFQLAAPNGDIVEYPPGQAALAALEKAEAELQTVVAAVPGVRMERKRFAIAVHYRHAAESAIGRLRRQVRDLARQSQRLRMSGGKKVFELVPDLNWHKGRALDWIMSSAGIVRKRVCPVYLGDDVTDEDAFEAVSPDGIGIAVGDGPRQTAARYHLADTAAVRNFLDRLMDVN